MMSKTKYILCDFITTVPSCVQTESLSAVLEKFSFGCDRVVVLDQQQYPIGVIRLQRLMPQIIQLSKGISLDLPQNLTQIGVELLEQVVTLPAQLNVEKFKSYLYSQPQQINADCEWALVDSDGKYLGLLDCRFWKFLASKQVVADKEHSESLQQPVSIPDRDSYTAAATIDTIPHLVMPRVLDTTENRYNLDLLVQLLEKLPIPLMLQTGRGEVISQNPAWCQQFGVLSEPEAVKQEVEAILKTVNKRHPSKIQNGFGSTSHQPAATDDLNSHCKLGNQPGTCICVWRSKNGQDRVWQIKTELLIWVMTNQLENEQIWVLLASDVTEQQQMASELVAKNADLILLNRLKDEFLACISHELRTPLTAMMGLSTLLENQALGQLNERQARYARLIHQNGRHLMSVVNDILDLTRMETGQLELTLEPVKIRSLCDRAIELALVEATPKTSANTTHTNNSFEHRFSLLIEPGLESIVADELRLRSMLVHLLANAFKFTESSGEIGLRVSYWAGWIAFTVWDTGIGIPEHQQHLIFQKFQQLENPLSRQFEGTGLGLVLTRALARLHGGDVSFFSQEGKGSQFTVLLPPIPPSKTGGAGEASGAGGQRGRGASRVRIPPLSGLAWAEEDTSDRGFPTPLRSTGETPAREWLDLSLVSVGQRGDQRFLIQNLKSKIQNRSNQLVLVVEAAPRFIENLTVELTSLGYWVVIARSGTEALEKARRLQPGAIFLNPLLPLLSGWDVLTLIKSDALTNHIPVIVTSTQAQKDLALSNQASEFLSLPTNRQVLQKLMTRFCGSPSVQKSNFSGINKHEQLTILQISQHIQEYDYNNAHPWLPNYQVLETSDVEQAALLAHIWQPDVVLLDKGILDPSSYLQQLLQYPSLAELPIVTLDAATTQAAKQINQLRVFPCLSTTASPPMHILSSVLEMAAGKIEEYSVLVVDIVPLSDLQQVSQAEELCKDVPCRVSTPADPWHTLRCEWLQALIQYLHTAGLRGVMAHSWLEMEQQIQQQSVDLILICLGEPKQAMSVLTALNNLSQQYKLPPLLVVERKFSQSEVREQFPHYLAADEQVSPSSYFCTNEFLDDFHSASNLVATAESDQVESMDVLGAIAAKILPSSVSMSELLENIHLILKQGRLGA